MIPLKDAIFCWTADDPIYDDPMYGGTRGKCAVFRAGHAEGSDKYASWLGGHCCFGYEDLSTQGKGIYVLIQCIWIMVMDGINPKEVFKNIICQIEELYATFPQDIIFSVGLRPLPEETAMKMNKKNFPSRWRIKWK